MSLGFEMVRCCIKEYAHFKAAKVGVSLSAFLESLDGDAASIDGLTSMTNRTASLALLYTCCMLTLLSKEALSLISYRIVKLLLLLFLSITTLLPSVLFRHD